MGDGNAGKSELWSQNRLALELGMDRATVRKRLRGVPADGRLQGNPAWRLSTALPYLRGERRPRPSNGPADGAEMPEFMKAWGAPWTVRPPGDTPEAHIGYAMAETGVGMLLRALSQVPANVAWIAVRCGAPMRHAFAMWQHSVVTVGMCLLDREVEAAGLRWRDPDGHYILPDEPDWAALAEIAGEPVDVEAWKRYASERFDGDACGADPG